MEPEYQFNVEGVRRVDLIDLQNTLGESNVILESARVPDERIAEPGTVAAIVCVSLAGLIGFFAWLQKTRKHVRERITIRLKKPDGTEIHIENDKIATESKEVNSKTIAEVGRAMGLSENVLKAVEKAFPPDDDRGNKDT